MNLLSVIILTFDEEVNIGYCLESLKDLPADVYVIDSGSRDKTLEIAASYNVKILHHAFENHAKQVNWAIDNISVKTPWIMRLDADERLTPELSRELKEILNSQKSDVTGMLIRRRIYFWNSWIRYGGYYPTWLLRVWRNGLGRYEERWMDEHMIISEGKIIKLQNDLIDENRKGLSFWTAKHNTYSDREVLDIQLTKGKTFSILQGQAAKRRFMKEVIYARSPLFLRPLLYWFYRYFILLGFLDGIPGLVFYFLQVFWYRFLVDAKLYEARKKSKNLPNE